MSYLSKLCNECLGCNLLENPYYTGKKDCLNYCKAKETGLDMCLKILHGEQLKLIPNKKG